MGVELDNRYQEEAYEAIQKSISDTGKAGVILPTGTGKTYLALKLIEDNLDKKQILYVSPSPVINAKTRKLISKTYDEKQAKEILSKVKFTTYQGMNKRYKNNRPDMEEYNSDVIVLDEVHRSGAEEWGKAVDYLLENNKDAQLLGMTATPLRSDGQNMIETRFGEAAYELKISDAVARGILKLPLYITSRYIFEEDIQNLEEKLEIVEDEDTRKELKERLNKAKKQVENANGLKDILRKHLEKNGKYLVFSNPGDNLEEIIEKARTESWFDEINENQTLLSVESNKSDTENDMALRRFERERGEDLRILFSKNMLNEGIHDEKITGEIMMRPTRSYILFVQQLGRVLSRDREETPVVLDLVGNIHYFKEFRAEIQQIIKEGEARGDRRYDPKVLEQFRIIEEQEDFIKSFEEIETALDRYLNAKRDVVGEYIEFIEKNGRRPTSYFTKNVNEKSIRKKANEMTKEEKYERNLLMYWYRTKEKGILDEYAGRPIEEVPEEYRSVITKLRELGEYGQQKTKRERGQTSSVEEYIKFLEENDGREPCSPQNAKTEKEREEYPIYRRWHQTDTYRILKQYEGRPIEEVPQEYRDVIARIRNAKKEEKSSTAEMLEVVRKLKEAGIDIQSMPCSKKINGKTVYLKLRGIELDGVDIQKIIEQNNLDGDFPIGIRITNLRRACSDTNNSCTYKVTEEEKREAEQLGIIGKEEIFGEAIKEYINFMKEKRRRPKASFYKREDGKSIKKSREELTEAERLEAKIRDKWYKSKERRKFNEYMGIPTEEVPEEYRDVIAKLRELGETVKKGRSGQEIGQASFEAPVEKCDEAQEVLEHLMEQQKETNLAF